MQVEDILSDLIQIKSVNPPGEETEVARYLKRLFDEHGIANEIIESAPGRGSFIAYLGEGDRSLLYLSHADVVPVSADWDFAPFCGEIKDGFVYGRGALDCKGLVAAEAYAMLTLARSGKLGGRLIFVATADEEAGGGMGAKYLVENYKEKLMADFCVNEGGKEPIEIGGKTCHFLQLGEKGVCWMKLRTRGVSAHGSLPVLGDNAVSKMAKIVKGLSEYQPEIVLIPEVEQLIRGIARLGGLDEDINEDNVDRTIRKLKDKVFAAYLSATTRMTVSPNVIHGGAKTNIVPDSCEAEVDIRVLPGQDNKYMNRQLGEIMGDVDVEITQYHPPTFSTSDSDYYRLVADTMKEFIGDVPILPCISSGATDSRFLREAGMPCYGISMMTLDLDQAMKQSVHGKNEKVDIASLRLKTDFLTRLAQKYLGD
ncbi:MAG: M20/M25/M40 family metallo-hydrolase [Dehalococcoidales bacterium]|nr:M20/M25/M40 family metallo-hydrolase [Dehalococcoidales bacterium]